MELTKISIAAPIIWDNNFDPYMKLLLKNTTMIKKER